MAIRPETEVDENTLVFFARLPLAVHKVNRLNRLASEKQFERVSDLRLRQLESRAGNADTRLAASQNGGS